MFYWRWSLQTWNNILQKCFGHLPLDLGLYSVETLFFVGRHLIHNQQWTNESVWGANVQFIIHVNSPLIAESPISFCVFLDLSDFTTVHLLCITFLFLLPTTPGFLAYIKQVFVYGNLEKELHSWCPVIMAWKGSCALAKVKMLFTVASVHMEYFT